MPKYVWEFSAILPADQRISPVLAQAIAGVMAEDLKRLLAVAGYSRHEVNFDEPFEHVIGDMLPADENGIVKVGPSRPIDL